MNIRAVWAITRNTFRDSIRSGWIWVYSSIFFLLALSLPLLVLLSVRYLPPNYLQIYLSALVTLTFPFLPLLTLPIGATSIVQERESGSLGYVLSAPVSKTTFLVGRFSGLVLATTIVVVLGIRTASTITFTSKFSNYYQVVDVAAIAALVNAVMVSLSLIISVLSRRKDMALALAIWFYLLFSVFSNLSLLTVVINLAWGPGATVGLLMLDPIELARILAVVTLNAGSQQYGSTGMTWLFVFGNNANIVIVGVLVVWFLVLFSGVLLIFRHQDVG